MIEHFTTAHDLTNATWEILIMLLGAFILGWLLHHFMHCCKKNKVQISAATNTTANSIGSFSEPAQIEDLKVVEGIGPKIESLLHAAGITTMQGLATTHTDVIKKILDDAGPRFRMHDPKTWSTQAELISAEEWDELTEYQNFLSGGKHS